MNDMNDWILGGIAFLLVLLYLGGVLTLDSAFRNREKIRYIFFPFSLSSSRRTMQRKILCAVCNTELRPITLTDVIVQLSPEVGGDFLYELWWNMRRLEKRGLIKTSAKTGVYYVQITSEGKTEFFKPR